MAPSVQDTDCLICSSYGPIRVFIKSLAVGNQRASLAGPSLLLDPFSRLQVPHLGSFSVVHRIRDLKITLAGVLLCYFARQVLKGPPSLCCFSCLVLICAERETIEMAAPSVCDSAVSPCLQVSWLCFISISHCALLSQVPSHHLPSVNPISVLSPT